MHILIIEDEATLCQSISDGLRMDGYVTDTCQDRNDALELCMTESFHFDVNMERNSHCFCQSSTTKHYNTMQL